MKVFLNYSIEDHYDLDKGHIYKIINKVHGDCAIFKKDCLIMNIGDIIDQDNLIFIGNFNSCYLNENVLYEKEKVYHSIDV